MGGRFPLALVFLIATSAACHARELYVSNIHGSDRYSGRQLTTDSDGGGPFATIAAAVRAARPGDEIEIDNTGTPYSECVTLTATRGSGLPDFPIVIDGNGAILDGSRPVPDHAWEHYKADVFRFTPRQQTYLCLFFEGRPVEEKQVKPTALAPPVLKPRQWCLLDSQVYFRVERGRTPDDYQLTQTGHAVGLTLYGVHDLVIRDLIVQGYQLDGVNAHDLVHRVELRGMTCRGNGRSGICVAGASWVSIAECLLGDNGRMQLRVEAPARVQMTDSDVLKSGVPRFAVQGGELTIDGVRFTPANRRLP